MDIHVEVHWTIACGISFVCAALSRAFMLLSQSRKMRARRAVGQCGVYAVAATACTLALMDRMQLPWLWGLALLSGLLGPDELKEIAYRVFGLFRPTTRSNNGFSKDQDREKRDNDRTARLGVVCGRRLRFLS